jgi:8-oxo-dGTP pyrophosphatase MutT (NUDIX family)
MTGFDDIIRTVRESFEKPLPGLASQLKMASMRRLSRDGRMMYPEGARKAGVLILLYPDDGVVKIIFIKRNEYPGVHSGQISFPGGGHEPGDEDTIATALREAEEETGIRRESVQIIGTLSELFIPPSNFLVTPVLAYTLTRPDFRPDPTEVEQLLEIPLDAFLDKNAKQEKEIDVFPALTMKVPCYFINGHVIWGATAMMLSEFLDLISPVS